MARSVMPSSRLSLSSWRAWIEICRNRGACPHTRSLSSWRAWIEIRPDMSARPSQQGRSPHGERGLKYEAIWTMAAFDQSLSSWRAWIEIRSEARSRGRRGSLSSWRAWIEIKPPKKRSNNHGVALLMESVD